MTTLDRAKKSAKKEGKPWVVALLLLFVVAIVERLI